MACQLFDIPLFSFDLSQLDRILDSKVVKTVANISDEEFERLWQENLLKYQDQIPKREPPQIIPKIKTICKIKPASNKIKPFTSITSTPLVKNKPAISPDLSQNELADLIPPDVDALSLEMNQIVLATPETEEYECDSVSLMSSEQSSYDELDISSTVDCGRPGVKLDRELIKRPTNLEINSFPRMDIYKCSNPMCGFTTSSSTNIKLHHCIR